MSHVPSRRSRVSPARRRAPSATWFARVGWPKMREEASTVNMGAVGEVPGDGGGDGEFIEAMDSDWISSF
jgi:hypothetical protein